MTSELQHPREAYAWVWLPQATEPVVAGRLVTVGGEDHFIYGRSYRERPDAIPLYLPELPLGSELIPPPANMPIAGAIRDGAPDAWGRRVILNKTFGAKGVDLDRLHLDELVFLLESGSDRIGALDFQPSATAYVPRGGDHTSVPEPVRLLRTQRSRGSIGDPC